MATQFRLAAIPKWLATLVSLVIFATWSFNAYVPILRILDLTRNLDSATVSEYSLRICNGCIIVEGKVYGSTRSWVPEVVPSSRIGLVLPQFTLNPPPWYSHTIVLPFWLLLTFSMLLGVYLWHREAKSRVIPGHCYHCGYDLTGNVSGACSECNTAIVGFDIGESITMIRSSKSAGP